MKDKPCLVGISHYSDKNTHFTTVVMKDEENSFGFAL